MTRTFSIRSILIALCALSCTTANAQDYPNRYIRVVVGPGPDIPARLIGPKITEALDQQVVIEPRPGAGGVIAAQTIATAPPDGYSLLLATASYTINTALQTSANDIRKDFAPIALVTTTPFVLVVHPSVPARTVQELIALARQKPGGLNYASSGIGTPPHLAGELFKMMAGIDIVHVPYREANSALNAVVSGAVPIMFSIVSAAQPQIESGSVRALGVTSAQPSAMAPGVPAIAQSGLKGFDVVGWNGFVAPAGTPEVIIAKLNATMMRALADPDLRKRLLAAGYEPAASNTPQEFAAYIRADTEKWIGVVEKTNMRAR